MFCSKDIQFWISFSCISVPKILLLSVHFEKKYSFFIFLRLSHFQKSYTKLRFQVGPGAPILAGAPGPICGLDPAPLGGKRQECQQQADSPIASPLLHNSAPRYLCDYCIPVANVAARSQLRSASRHQVVVPRYNTSTFGRRAFSVAGPTVWNSLPDKLRDPSLSIDSFRRQLKTFLFAD